MADCRFSAVCNQRNLRKSDEILTRIMTPIDFIIFIGVGCVIGFLAGMFGVGGGILMVPVLFFSYEQSGVSSSVLTHIAIGHQPLCDHLCFTDECLSAWQTEKY